jgi:hypothetical protein
MFGSSQFTHPFSPFSSFTVHTLVGSTCTALQHMGGRAHQELGHSSMPCARHRQQTCAATGSGRARTRTDRPERSA